MKPKKILLFLLLVLSITLGIALLFPADGIRITDKFSLKFAFDLSDLKAESPKYADISNIITENKTIEADTVAKDSTLTIEEEQPIDTIRANASSLKKSIQSIEYPAGDNTILFSLFKKLNKASTKRVRIMHYGDSQIEGDRITGYLRNKFQKQFGGSGPGFMPALPSHAESASIIHKASSNWIKHAAYYKKDTILPHRKFGILGSFARFTSYQSDSTNDSNDVKNAWIEFNRSGLAYSSVRKFTECRVFYGHNNNPFTVKGFVNDSLIWFEELDTLQNTQTFKWQFQYPPRKFRIEFEGSKSPDVYAIALDAATGVSVDNLPFRGSSGTEFTRLDFKQLQEMNKHMNPGLIMLEFGVNIVPHIIKNYNYYERALTRQIKYLKYVFPNTPVLIISVSDMSMKKGNYYVSYPNISKIKQAQKNAALNTNSAYWDLQQAMGGENSMPSWVFSNPKLASKDFIHFTRNGGHIVAQMLYNAMMQDYNTYQQLNANSQNK